MPLWSTKSKSKTNQICNHDDRSGRVFPIALLLEAAETDKLKAAQQAGVLQRLLPSELAAAIDAVSFHASWHAANLRRLVVWDACKQACAFTYHSPGRPPAPSLILQATPSS